MVRLIASNGEIQYNINEYCIDTPDDIANLPVDCAMGSIAIVISTAEVYMKNGSGEWVNL